MYYRCPFGPGYRLGNRYVPAFKRSPPCRMTPLHLEPSMSAIHKEWGTLIPAIPGNIAEG